MMKWPSIGLLLALSISAPCNGGAFVPYTNLVDLKRQQIFFDIGKETQQKDYHRIINNRPTILHHDVIKPPRRKSSSLQAFSASAVLEGVKGLHSNTSYVLTLVLWISTFGVSMERKTTIGKALSAPLATMALALTVANVGLLPFQSPICKFSNVSGSWFSRTFYSVLFSLLCQPPIPKPN